MEATQEEYVGEYLEEYLLIETADVEEMARLFFVDCGERSG